ncbi:MAG: hypothetical protein WCL00_14420, partial [Bacteroidota bacterium]
MGKYTGFWIFAYLLLLIPSPLLFSQSMDDEPVLHHPNHIRRIIFLEDTVKWRHLMVKERDFIRFYIIDTASLQKGKITRIDHDTLITKNGIMMMKDISRIDLGHSGKPRFNVRRSWIHLLPDSAYQSTESKHRAMAKIHQSIHKRRAIFRTDSVHSNFIKLNLARLFGLEIAFSYERKISRKISLELELGYGFPIYVHTPPGNGNPFEAFPYFPSEGYSIYIGPKFYNLSAPNSHGFY